MSDQNVAEPMRELFRQYIIESRGRTAAEESIVLLSVVHHGWEHPDPSVVDFIFETCPDDCLSFSKFHGAPARDWYKAMSQVWEGVRTLDEFVFVSAVESSGPTEFTRENIGALWFDSFQHGFQYDIGIIRRAIDILVSKRNEIIIVEATGSLRRENQK